MKKRVSETLLRYVIATFGLFLIALGVGLSIKSDLGTAPVSCPPYVVNLWNSHFTVGEYTMMMHGIFILLQILLLRRDFKLAYLMQIPAAVVFGLLTDLCIWGTEWITAGSYATRMGLCLLTVLVTAAGVSLEVFAGAWMLAGEQTTAAIAQVSGLQFSNVKIGFDIFLVLISGIFAYIVFGNPLGDGRYIVIREGTLILAVFTGLCMKLTDPLVKKICAPLISGSDSPDGPVK